MPTNALDFKNTEDVQTIQNITNVIKAEVVSSFAKEQREAEKDFTADYEKVLNMTTLSMKMFANSYYKSATFLEASDIEQIKDSLNNYTNDSDKVTEFKNAIIDDLTEFQKQIKTNHVQKLAELGKQKQFLEKQIRILDVEKNKLVMERLAKIVWPYDQKTKEYDAKIAKLQMQVQKYAQKIEDLQQMRPAADEKDILLYQMSFKDKFKK